MLVIMGFVITALASSFVAGLRTEVDHVRRQQATANARLALSRMRADIHCAASASAPEANPYGGFTLTLTHTPGLCPGVTSSSSGVQWCTIPVSGSPTRFALYRYLGTTVTDCNGGAGSTFMVDYIAPPVSGWPTNAGTTPTPLSWDGNVWPTPANCPTDHLPTVDVALSVNVDPVGHPNERYQLDDRIALRNAFRCL